MSDEPVITNLFDLEQMARERLSKGTFDYIAGGADDEAMVSFQRELARERHGHLYAKECCANAWYAIGACHLRRGDAMAARAAFGEAIARAPRHPMAHAGMAILEQSRGAAETDRHAESPMSVDTAMAQAAVLVAQDDTPAAVRIVAAALVAAPPGSAGWLIPLDPLLAVRTDSDAWAPVLQRLRDRSA